MLLSRQTFLFSISIDATLNENLPLVLSFFLVAFIIWSKANFSIMQIMEFTLFFSADMEVSLSQLKNCNESTSASKCLLKVESKNAVLIIIHRFQVTSFLPVCCYFNQRSKVQMVSKMVWSCNQQLVSQSIAVWLVYSNLQQCSTFAEFWNVNRTF